MDSFNVLNIPAYQRKRSIAAKAKRKPISPKARPRKRTRRYAPPLIEEISIQPRTTSEEMFPNPLDNFSESAESREPEYDKEIREMMICGHCEGYFDKIEVAVVKLTSTLREGDRILFETTDGLFEQTVSSMQINRKQISMARSGSDIGLKVLMEPKVGGNVYKVI